MQKSVNGYNIEKLNVYNRSNSFYQERGGNKNLELESTSFNKNTENSSVKYNYSFSDDSSLVDGRRIDIVVQDQDSINRFNTFSSLGVKQFVQKVDSTTQGSRDLRISIEGQESDTLDILLGVAKLIANNHVKIYNDTYIDDATYNFDVEEKTLQVSVKYNFNKLVRSKEIL